MAIAHSVSEILKNHVTLEIEGIDRMYLNAYVPELQYATGAASFFRFHRGAQFASNALMGPMSHDFVNRIEQFAKAQQVEIYKFTKGERKDEVMKEKLKTFKAEEGIVFIGKAQEKIKTFRTEKRKHPQTGVSYPWLVESTAIPNQYYFYGVDKDFGPFFIKFSSYFPYNAKLCLNGHEYLKRQLAQRDIAFEALDNGLRCCKDPKKAQQICDGFNEHKIEKFFRKWLKILPHPFSPKDRRAGYKYEVSMLQSEFSLTQVLDRPKTGRILFEEIIRENLDIGRPSQVQLVFNRRVNKNTPGRFRTRVITEEVSPSLHVDYKSSRIKQYHKEGQALRTETTINNTYDFQIGKRLKNLPELRQIGFSANRRLLDVQMTSHDCSIGDQVFFEVSRPVHVEKQRGSALRFSDKRAQALLNALLLFGNIPEGFANKHLRKKMALLMAKPEKSITQGQMTYDLRRLRLHGLIERIEKTHRYQMTQKGLRVAALFTRTYNRVLRKGLSSNQTKPQTSNNSWIKLEKLMDQIWHQEKLAA